MFTKIQSPKTSKHLGSLLVLSTLMAIVAQFLVAAPAKSQQQCPVCEYNGTCYAAGETVGPFICRADGNWQRNN